MNNFIQEQINTYNPRNAQELEQALRELLQELALIGLWRAKFFEHAAFYGGTALRILYGLDRFSEDLDFTLLKPNPDFNWQPFIKELTVELASYGFQVDVTEKKKNIESDIRSAFLKTNTLESLIQVNSTNLDLQGVNGRSLIKIRIEVDTTPPPGLNYEHHYLARPFPRPIRVVRKEDLFAGKMHAAIYRAWKNRVKGRDLWDVIWFIRSNTAINLDYVAACMHKKGKLTANKKLTKNDLIELFINRIENIDIETAKDDIRPFVNDASVLDEWSIDFFRYWINKIKTNQK